MQGKLFLSLLQHAFYLQGRKYGGGACGAHQPPAFENFVFFAQKNEKNCAFESILVTNPYERTCYASLLPDLEILAVDAPLAQRLSYAPVYLAIARL